MHCTIEIKVVDPYCVVRTDTMLSSAMHLFLHARSMFISAHIACTSLLFDLHSHMSACFYTTVDAMR